MIKAFFTTILHELGVDGLDVEEVISLDDATLAALQYAVPCGNDIYTDSIISQPLVAMIFLFRYSDIDSGHQNFEDASDHSQVWFARQVPLNACASVALLNIVNNATNIADLGPELCALRAATVDASPFDKGMAIADNNFVRRVHNSFARELDIFDSDLSTKWRYEKLARQARAKSRQAPSSVAQTGTTDLRRSNRKRKQPLVPPDCDDTPSDDSAFHFIAYMPIEDKVWKLDGMDRSPQQLGFIPQNGTWLSLARDAIQARMLSCHDSQLEFNLMAIVADPASQARRKLIENLRITRDITTCHDTPFDAATLAEPDLGITAEEFTTGPAPIETSERLIAASDEPASVLQDLDSERPALRSAVLAGQAARAAVAERTELRRYDYKPFLTAWVRALRKQGSIGVLKAKIEAGT